MASMARLCSSCERDRDKCIKCGNYISYGGAMALLCSSCERDRDRCIICGGYC